jgi:IstB-like ATP binding protein
VSSHFLFLPVLECAAVEELRGCADSTKGVAGDRVCDLALARSDGRYPRLIRALGDVKLLILDDWGLEPLGPEQCHDMLEIVGDRYGRGATLITSQIPVDRIACKIGIGRDPI